MHSPLASKYAAAFFELAKESGQGEAVLTELRKIEGLLSADESFVEFFSSPLVTTEQKEVAISKALEPSGASTLTQSFLSLLALRGRLTLLNEISEAFQKRIDEEHGVVRGNVRSAQVLGPAEREQIEKIVSQATKKQVLLHYEQDPEVIGGLVAQVGSLTFDDSISSHMGWLKEEVSQRAN